MSLAYLREAVASGDHQRLIRYVRLHLGDGNEEVGRREVDKAWVEALKALLELPPTNRQFIQDALEQQTPETLAHLFFYLHLYLVRRGGEWIHDGEL